MGGWQYDILVKEFRWSPPVKGVTVTRSVERESEGGGGEGGREGGRGGGEKLMGVTVCQIDYHMRRGLMTE